MSDSPVVRGTVDQEEQPVLERLLEIRDKLLLLKQDRSKYVKSQEVIEHYNDILQQIGTVNRIRSDRKNEQNRLDTVLDDCLQLISLFFLTIGRNNEAPAAYSTTSTIKRLLDHLKEAGYFSGKDLAGISYQLDKIQKSIEQDHAEINPHIRVLLETRIDICKTVLTELRLSLSQLSPELSETYEKLVSILRTLSGLNFRPKFPEKEVAEYQKQLKEIEAGFDDYSHDSKPSDQTAEEQYVEKLKHLNYDNSATIPGRDLVLGLLERCSLWSEIMMHRKGQIQERFKETFGGLAAIRNQLEKLHLTQAWSLRETDLYGYQRKLERIDDARVDGNIVDGDGSPAEIFEQRAFLYLLRRSYAIIYLMITSSEPVSEALLPVYNQLTTLRKCLEEVKKSGGVSSPRELYPYSMKLHSIDNMRQDGKFIVNGDIPEGQGSVTALLHECFDLAYELRNEAEAEEDDDDDDDDSDNEKTSGDTLKSGPQPVKDLGTGVGIETH